MSDIGSTLREARMRERIDISEVEARTKIRAKYLRAIENEEWDLLPGPVYAKSFLRTYGDFLGLDSRMLIDEFKRRYESPNDHDIRPATTIARERERERRRQRPRLPAWAPIAVVVVVLVGVLYVVGKSSQSSSSTSTHKPRHHPHHRAPAKTTLPATPANVTLQLGADKHRVRLSGQRLGREADQRADIHAPAETIPTETAPTLLLTLGNAAVQMKVNGKAVPVAPVGELRSG